MSWVIFVLLSKTSMSLLYLINIVQEGIREFKVKGDNYTANLLCGNVSSCLLHVSFASCFEKLKRVCLSNLSVCGSDKDVEFNRAVPSILAAMLTLEVKESFRFFFWALFVTWQLQRSLSLLFFIHSSLIWSLSYMLHNAISILRKQSTAY